MRRRSIIRQISTLKPEEQERALAMLQRRGALPKPQPQHPGLLWCGHRDRVSEDDPGDIVAVEGIEICGACRSSNAKT